MRVCTQAPTNPVNLLSGFLLNLPGFSHSASGPPSPGLRLTECRAGWRSWLLRRALAGSAALAVPVARVGPGAVDAGWLLLIQAWGRSAVRAPSLWCGAVGWGGGLSNDPAADFGPGFPGPRCRRRVAL